ncbi:MAG: TlpA family protein disulfide reductase [Cyclobacteriaceae bacterium]|nr:TlpA family protein disulfide reductase [Cyclobacteriaceae bacterium]
MRRKHFIYLLVLVFIACTSPQQQAEGQEGLKIFGKINNPQQGTVSLEMAEENQFIFHSNIEIGENGSYEHPVDISAPGIYRVNFYDLQQVVLILDQDAIELNVDGSTAQGFKEIKGSRDHDLISNVQQQTTSFQTSPEFVALNQKFQEAAQSKNEQVMANLRAEYAVMEDANLKKIAGLIRQHPTSLAAVDLLRSGQFLDKDKYFEVYEFVAGEITDKYPDLKYVASFKEMVDGMKKLAIGQVAPDFSLPNPDGEMVSLSSLRGNYVLVDFWAKWCRPCRVENPNVVRMYNKYNEKGFEVFGVSLDRNKEDWLQAIEEDGLTWTHVSDLKFWNSEAAKLYGVTAIPFALLLNPDGEIIGKNLRGQALESKLAEIFN